MYHTNQSAKPIQDFGGKIHQVRREPDMQTPRSGTCEMRCSQLQRTLQRPWMYLKYSATPLKSCTVPVLPSDIAAGIRLSEVCLILHKDLGTAMEPCYHFSQHHYNTTTSPHDKLIVLTGSRRHSQRCRTSRDPEHRQGNAVIKNQIQDDARRVEKLQKRFCVLRFARSILYTR